MTRRATTPRRDRRPLLAALVIALVLALVPRAALANPLDWSLEAHATPARMWVGVELEVELTLRNLGLERWSPLTDDRVAYHWRDAEGELVILDGLRTELPEVVEPGESITVRARVRPPDRPGSYALEWAIVREHVRWFPPPRDGPVDHGVRVEAGAFGWALGSVSLPATLEPGVAVTVPARLANTGEIPWQPELGDAIAYHWWSDEGELLVREGRRTSMPELVESGAEVEVEVWIEPPSVDGPEPARVCLELEPLREGVRWFGPPDRPAPLTCTRVAPDPLRWEPIDVSTPARLAVEADEQRITVLVRNTGTATWSDEDRLGYRFRGPAGGELIDGARTGLPPEVAPAEIVELEARLAAPERPELGAHELIWGMVREGERWFAEPPGARRTVEITGPRLAWGLIRAESPRRVWVNRSTRVAVELDNLGTETWSEATGDHLAYHWLDDDGEVVSFDGWRTGFAEPVAPGERVEVDARLHGPRRPGVYRLQWELVREHDRWYGPPVEGGLEPPRVRARNLAAIWILTLAGLTIVGAVGLRLRPPSTARTRTIVEQLPLLWAGLAIWTLALTFHDFSGIEPRARASLLEASGAWVPVAALTLARGRVRAWLAAALVAAVALLGLADLVYMHYFGSIVPVVALTASHHLGEVSDSAIAELEGDWVWLAIVPLAGVVAAAMTPRLGRLEPPMPAGERPRLARAWSWLRPRLPALCVCLVLAMPTVLELRRSLGGKLGKRVFSEQEIVSRYGYLNAHLFDLARAVRERGRRGRPSAEELARIHAWFDARAAAVEPAVPVRGGEAEGHNLLLIQIEAAQSWVIGLEVAGQEVTPLLNRLRTEADWFPYVVDQTNQGKTSDAEYAVLNSQHPLGEGAICFLRTDNHFFTLAHILRERGYATLSAHPYKRGFWNRAVLHPRYGFERSLFRRELGPGQEVGWGLADGLFFERIEPELEALPQPWFAFLVTLSLHHPYDEFPQNLAALELGPLEGTRVGNYLEAMNYFDRSLARLLGQLDEAGLLDHTVVALYGDHDARFELDAYPEVIELAGAPSWDPALFHRLERVPLFVRVPGRAPRGRVGVTGGHVDVGPTLLHTLGVPRPPSFVGRALLPGGEDEGFAAYPDGSAFGPVPLERAGERGRMYVAEGRGIPRLGGCFEFPDGGSRPLAECRELAVRSAEELEISRAVVDHDLHRELAGR